MLTYLSNPPPPPTPFSLGRVWFCCLPLLYHECRSLFQGSSPRIVPASRGSSTARHHGAPSLGLILSDCTLSSVGPGKSPCPSQPAEQWHPGPPHSLVLAACFSRATSLLSVPIRRSLLWGAAVVARWTTCSILRPMLALLLPCHFIQATRPWPNPQDLSRLDGCICRFVAGLSAPSNYLLCLSQLPLAVMSGSNMSWSLAGGKQWKVLP